MDLIYNIILLILTLLALIMAYGIVIRTSKTLRKGIIFLLLALILLAIKCALDMFKINNNFNIIYIILIILLLLGLYQIRKAIKTVDGELTSNGKIKIKRGGAFYKKLIDWIKNVF